MTLDNILIGLCIVLFIAILGMLRLWCHFEKEKRNRESLMTEEDKLIYDTYIKPVENDLKAFQCELKVYGEYLRKQRDLQNE